MTTINDIQKIKDEVSNGYFPYLVCEQIFFSVKPRSTTNLILEKIGV
jgi:hypothetical protein